VPVAPAAAAGGCGACCWESIVTATVMTPPASSAAPTPPASLARNVPGGAGAGANSLSGQDMTTRSPATRGGLPKGAPSACLPQWVLLA
jgi:hypothetical protein